MTEIYLDNAATTKPYPEVCQAVYEAMQNNYGNPSSYHTIGMKAEKALRHTRKTMAKCIGGKETEIYFTSGGTESDNIAVLGYTHANRKKFSKVITSCIEHDAVLESVKVLEQEGVEVSYLPVGQNGVIDLEAFQKELTVDTGLVSVMSVNNETGAIQPIDELKSMMKSVCPQAVLHVDHVQGFGKIPLSVKKSGIDLLSMSGHKIHGPKGIGILYMREGLRALPMVYGGHQEKNMRSGTQSVYDIIGLGIAAERGMNTEKNQQIRALRDELAQRIMASVHDCRLNTDLAVSSPHVLNVSFPGLRSEVLLHSLEARGIFVSTGSACASNKPELSHTLLAMGRTHEEIDSAVRFSFSEFNTKEEIDVVIATLQEEVTVLRRYMGGNR